MGHRRILQIAASIALVLVVAACGDDEPAAEWPETLPSERAALAELFDPVVEPYGYRVTRAALVDRSTYERTADGDHLALYVAPDAYLTADEIATDFPLLVSLFLPKVFEQWPALQSFDVCQEPYESDQPVPPSLTLFDITREAAETIEWSDLELADLIPLHERDGISVFARTVIRRSDVWETASEG